MSAFSIFLLERAIRRADRERSEVKLSLKAQPTARLEKASMIAER
jgi:hypothetical protein